MRKTTTEEHRDVPGWLVLELVSEPRGSALTRSTQALYVVADGRMLYQGGQRFGDEEVRPEGGYTLTGGTVVHRETDRLIDGLVQSLATVADEHSVHWVPPVRAIPAVPQF